MSVFEGVVIAELFAILVTAWSGRLRGPRGHIGYQGPQGLPGDHECAL